MAVQLGNGVPEPTVSVVIPTLNEARNLPHVLARLPADIHEIIIVDGHSVDDTLTVARQLRPNVRIATQTRNGKGNALVCGFAIATGDVIAIIDGDGSADPCEIPRFVEALVNGADYVKGTRFARDPRSGSDDITRLRKLGNRMLCGLVNVCYGTKYSDLCYGLNVFWRRVIPVVGIDTNPAPSAHGSRLFHGDGFEIDTLLNIRVAKAKLAVTEVPSFEHSRIHGVSNLNAVGDGMRVLRTICTEFFGHRVRTPAPSRATAAANGHSTRHVPAASAPPAGVPAQSMPTTSVPAPGIPAASVPAVGVPAPAFSAHRAHRESGQENFV
jgi:hypothetical protein